MQGKPPEENPGSASRASSVGSEFVHARSYNPPNWFTPEGVRKKQKAIEAKGLPDFTHWKFLTLTIDPAKFGDCPLTAYLAGRKKLSKFLYAMRQAGICGKVKWAWKLEFTRRGWVHWHLLLEHKPRWSVDQMRTITRLWGYGIVHCEAIRSNSFGYHFKYAFKGSVQEDESDPTGITAYTLPDWFLDYVGSRTIKTKTTDANGNESTQEIRKPVSFSRVRFWQTSAGFYTGANAVPGGDRAEAEGVGEDPKPVQQVPQSSSYLPLPARVAAERFHRTIQIVARNGVGKYVKSAVLTLNTCRSALWVKACWSILDSEAHGLGVNSFVLPVSKIETLQTWQLQLVRLQNKLTPRQASRLPPRNWATF